MELFKSYILNLFVYISIPVVFFFPGFVGELFCKSVHSEALNIINIINVMESSHRRISERALKRRLSSGDHVIF